MSTKMNTLLAFSFLFLSTLATPSSSSTLTCQTTGTPVYPKLAYTPNPTGIANVTDPSVSRDSCGSVLIGNNAFWTCRDTQQYDPTTGKGQGQVYSNTCGWTTFNSTDQPNIITNGTVGADSNGTNPILQMMGCDPLALPLLFEMQMDECPKTGVCNNNGTRWVLWPDSPPMVTSFDSEGTVVAYTWIKKANVQQGNISHVYDPEPPCSLYNLTFTSDEGFARPTVMLVNETFWQQHNISYGSYGNVVKDGIAYLYGQTDAGMGTTLAMVPAESVTDVSQYQYYVNNAWTSQMPGINDSSAIIPNAGAGGQGTFYYSEYFSSYIWLGQNKPSQGTVANFWISTAPCPEGPWIEPYNIFKGANGNGNSHSLQAHPALLESPGQNGIYITWTLTNNNTAYITPLVYLEWE